MSRRFQLAVAALVVLAAGCGRLGTGLPGCDTPPSDPNAATVLTLQAVPTAEYAPCINAIPLGWDEVEFDVASDLMRLELGREFSPFLEVRLTPSCEIGDAVAVPSGMDDIMRYDSIEEVTDEILVTIIPVADRPLEYSRSLIEDLRGVRADGRPVVFSLDENIDLSVRPRVDHALFTAQFVWIINDLDIDEGTLEMRATPDGEGARGLTIEQALDRMDDMVGDVRYEGEWFFVFEGGCITYDFDAGGSVAATIAEDAEEAIGFYPSAELRRAARDAGYELIDR